MTRSDASPGLRPMRTLAAALAAAAASAPATAGMTLALSSVVFNDVVWAAAAAFAAGALLQRAAPWFGRIAGVSLFAWFALVAAQQLHLGRPAADVPWWHLATAATAAVALPIGLRARRAFVLALVALVAGWLVAMILRYDDADDALRRWSHLGLAAGALAAAALARRRRDAASIAAALVTIAMIGIVRHVVLVSGNPEFTIAVSALLAATPLAGAIASEIDRGIEGDAGARLVVIGQRHPWATSLLLACLLAGLGGTWAWDWFPEAGIHGGFTLALLLPVGFAFLSHVAHGARDTADRLAPWLGVNLAAMALTAGYVHASRTAMPLPNAAGLVAVIALWPLVSGAVLPGQPPGDGTPIAASVLPVAIAALPPVTSLVGGSIFGWRFGLLLAFVVAPIAFHAVVRSRWPARRIVACAAAFGVAWAFLAPSEEPGEGELLGPLGIGVWIAASLLAVAARRSRSMTAVPRDHPVVEELGGA